MVASAPSGVSANSVVVSTPSSSQAKRSVCVVDVQQPLVRRVALGRVAAPELVPLRQLDLGVLGQPDAQLGRVGQGVADGLDRRGERGPGRVIGSVMVVLPSGSRPRRA